jgi:dolichol-phosphate mannosyltransferase
MPMLDPSRNAVPVSSQPLPAAAVPPERAATPELAAASAFDQPAPRFRLDRTVGRHVPVRFVLFSAVGVLGMGLHLTVLRVAMAALGFSVAQGVATLVAMTNNFLMNNAFTYRDRRLRGRKMLRGLFSFWLVCGCGAIANVAAASFVFRQQGAWWVSGIAGAVVSAAWNYGVSSVVTWPGRRMEPAV